MHKNKIIKKLQKVSNKYLRRLVIKHNLIEYQCSICEIKEWLGKPLSLHLDHIDGDSYNNSLSNLRFLCPNCDSQTDTYCFGNGPKCMINKKEIIIELYKNNNTICQILRTLKMATSGPNYKQIRKILNLD